MQPKTQTWNSLFFFYMESHFKLQIRAALHIGLTNTLPEH